jgi:bifunctional non-homologous end joining protein LigD
MMPRTIVRTPSGTVMVAGVTLSNPDRVLYPDQGITKRELAEYYVRVASRMLPHVANRPLSLVRCPQGQPGACFYQKHWTSTLPLGLEEVRIEEESGDRAPYVAVRDLQGLVSLVQHGVLEVHPWGSRVDTLERPDRVVFDLDPAPDVAWPQVVLVARRVRALLEACGLKSWVKTTGGKGLHVVLPIVADITWNDLHDFVRLTTARLVADDPEGLVDVASKAARANKIFVDYLRNGRGATAVAPWSTRSREGAPVAMPVSWLQLDELTGGDAIRVATVESWLRTHRADPWASLLRHQQHITESVMEKLLTVQPAPDRPMRRRRSRAKRPPGEGAR